ncbi:MAG: beta-ribofuranosylaminobenzene 5'-phosphate synthase [Methanotrichaceae archaeon]|nr:beta-ribofuranosylaminobenzene 5'-phosphate synthase [Methanotrichaceae archaeon]
MSPISHLVLVEKFCQGKNFIPGNWIDLMYVPAAFPIAQKITDIENVVGRLSPVQKMLLGTDGSVTSLLEVITGSKIEIETLEQSIVPADELIAEKLNVQPGDEVNHRIVKLKRADNEEILIYAISHTPIKRLEPEFKYDLTRADIPIGVILKKHFIESRRDIVDAGALQADKKMSQIFNIFPRELMLSRDYRIVRHGEPLIAITETFPFNSFRDERKIIIQTPSRIHMTLTDLTGTSGRVDGGVGIALEEPNILLEAERCEVLVVEGEGADRAKAAAEAVMERFGLGAIRLSIRGAYRSHIGLGSGTQLGIAAGKAVCELYDFEATGQEIAQVISRGGTSGIGTAAFDFGGFIIDAGHTFGPGKQKTDFRPSSASKGVKPPAVITRHDFPEDWKIVLAIPNLPKGAYGQREIDIFKDYCPVPVEDVHELCYQILVRMVPSIVEQNLDDFGSAVNRIQELGFKRVEVMLQHPLVHKLMMDMRAAGAACSGLSSFGPTVYAVTDSQSRDIETVARKVIADVGGDVLITKARNEGARIRAA